VRRKRERYVALVARARAAMDAFLATERPLDGADLGISRQEETSVEPQ